MKYKISDFRQYSDWFKMMLIIVVILILFFFGIKGASSDILRADELTTLGHIGALEPHPNGVSLLETMNSLATYSAQHPPLYFLTANIWGRFLSYHSFILSLLSVFWGILGLATFYRLAKDVGGASVAFYTALLSATSAFYVFYTHDIRQYSSLLFWATLTWLIYQRLCRQTKALTLGQLALLTFVTLCTIYTHYTAIFLLAAIGLYHLLFVPKTKAWWQISSAIVFAGVLYLPWVPTMLSGLDSMIDKFPKIQDKILNNNELLNFIVLFMGNGQAVLFAILVGLGLIASVFNSKSRYALTIFTMVFFVIFVINGNFEFIKQIRYILVLILPLYLLGGFGLTFLHRWRLLPLIFLIAWMVSGTNFQLTLDYKQQTQLLPVQPYIEYNYLVPLLQATLSSDDLLITANKSDGAIQSSKQDKMSLEDYYLSPLNIPYISVYGEYKSETFGIADLLEAIADHPSFWLTYASRNVSELEDFVSAIEDRYTSCKLIRFGDSSKLEQYIQIERFEELCSD